MLGNHTATISQDIEVGEAFDRCSRLGYRWRLTKSPSLLPGGLIEPCSYVATQRILPSVPMLLEVLVGDLIVVFHHLA